jgi:hypothetical protein
MYIYLKEKKKIEEKWSWNGEKEKKGPLTAQLTRSPSPRAPYPLPPATSARRGGGRPASPVERSRGGVAGGEEHEPRRRRVLPGGQEARRRDLLPGESRAAQPAGPASRRWSRRVRTRLSLPLLPLILLRST